MYIADLAEYRMPVGQHSQPLIVSRNQQFCNFYFRVPPHFRLAGNVVVVVVAGHIDLQRLKWVHEVRLRCMPLKFALHSMPAEFFYLKRRKRKLEDGIR